MLCGSMGSMELWMDLFFFLSLLLSCDFDSVTGNWQLSHYHKSMAQVRYDESRYEMRVFVSSPNIFVVFGDAIFFCVIAFLSFSCFFTLGSSCVCVCVCVYLVHFVHIIYLLRHVTGLQSWHTATPVNIRWTRFNNNNNNNRTIQQFTNSFYWFLLILSCIFNEPN